MQHEHKTLCKETMKARFAAIAQTSSVVKTETKRREFNKPMVIKKKSEVSVSKNVVESLKLPSFDTFVSLTDAKTINLSLQGSICSYCF